MSSDINLDTIRKNTFERLLSLVNSGLVNDKGIALTNNYNAEYQNNDLYFQILTISTFELIRKEINKIHPSKETHYERLLKSISENLQKGDFKIITDHREQLQENFRSSILNKDYDYPDLEIFSFNSNNKFLNTAELVRVFKSQVHPLRLRKFKYIVEQEGENYNLDSQTTINLKKFFPDAYDKFINLIRNRVKLYCVEQVINYLEENEEKFNLKGDKEIFRPDSDFATIFNKSEELEELPDLIYKFIDQTGFELDKPFFERLNIFLRNCKSNKRRVLMYKRYQPKFNRQVGIFLGKKYKYEKDKFESKKYDEFEEDIINFLKFNNLNINSMYD